MLTIVLLIFSFGILTGLDVLTEMPELEYFNPKYVQSMKLKAGKTSRRSPYYVSLDVHTLTEIGNNITLQLSLLEYLSGKYHPTPLQATYKLCDFLYKEPFLGQMYAKQIPYNWTCPFPAGDYNFTNFVIHMENFPYNIPFISSSVYVKTRSDVQGYHTTTGEVIFKWKCYVTLVQKPKYFENEND